MIELTIKLDTDKIENAVREAWQYEFTRPEGFHRRDAGAGWTEVTRQVRAYIETLDLTSVIAAAAKSSLNGIVREVVASALREEVKKRAKEMTKDGTLFSDSEQP